MCNCGVPISTVIIHNNIKYFLWKRVKHTYSIIHPSSQNIASIILYQYILGAIRHLLVKQWATNGFLLGGFVKAMHSRF